MSEHAASTDAMEILDLRAQVRDLKTQISALALANVHAAELVVALEEAREREAALVRRGEELALQSRLDALFQLERRELSLLDRARSELEATRGLSLMGPIRESDHTKAPAFTLVPPDSLDGNLLHLPIHSGEIVHAVWTLRIAEPDALWRERWLDQLWSIGSQIGMAIQRLRAEDENLRLTKDLIDRIADLQRATQRQSTAEAVTRIFADSTTSESGVPKVLEAIGRSLDWVVAIHWSIDPDSRLTCRHLWTDGRGGLEAFLAETQNARYSIGDAFPGKTWEAGRAIWVDDFAQFRGYPRQASAETALLHSGVAFPVIGAEGILGVVEFVADDRRPIDPQMLAFFDAVGSQLGQFMERKAADVERALAEAEVRRLAHNDPLTGLHNRLYLTTALDEAVASAKAREANLALMFLDLDRFKPINDTLGHAIGDKLLCEVANRLRKSVRDSDIVARVGGDEFVVVLPNVADSAVIRRIAASLVQTLSQPYEIAPHTLRSRPSVGISVYPFDGTDPTTLLRNADLAMYHAKEAAQDPVHFYSEKMLGRNKERLALDDGLHRAIERGEFQILYQPQTDLRTGQIVGAEALIRWNHPVDGVMLPDKFIPIAEENGLIYPIGRWVIREVCRQLNAWRADGLPVVPIAVNLSAKQFRQDSLAEAVSSIAEDAGVDPSLLEIELTESTVMRKAELAADVLGTLNVRGFRIAIDDFGTGYSSLAYLRQFPVHKVKIDRSFVLDLPEDDNAVAIAIAIIRMAKSLGLQVVAEGVETEAQRAFLAEQGADIMQGYLFSKPVDAPMFARHLSEHCMVTAS